MDDDCKYDDCADCNVRDSCDVFELVDSYQGLHVGMLVLNTETGRFGVIEKIYTGEAGVSVIARTDEHGTPTPDYYFSQGPMGAGNRIALRIWVNHLAHGKWAPAAAMPKSSQAVQMPLFT